MITVWKFPIAAMDSCKVSMPKNARILTVQSQPTQTPSGRLDEVCLWALVDTRNDTEEREFLLRGTGHGIPDGLNLIYIGTFQMNTGRLVFHLFERLTDDHS